MAKRTGADFFDTLQGITESCLTRRRRKQRIKKEKQRKKNVIVDWIEAFLWAAGVVLLINQYLFQAYQIPSGSMIDTLLIKDHIFVNKIIYGPELLPGMGKLPSPVRPKREDVIIFENPDYFSNGPVFDIAQRIIYMLTLSIVDIDRDESGNPRVHFLIKRAAGMGGDHFVSRRGELFIRFAGEDRWVSERDHAAAAGFKHNLSRLQKEEDYQAIEAAGRVSAYINLGLMPPAELEEAASGAGRIYDSLTREEAMLRVIRSAAPHDERYRAWYNKQVQGWYVPEGRALPLGDNRDNSQDGRFFGPVKLSKILGKGSLIYWPGNRIGFIR
ncbi:MAG: signal peptidase I [Treponema sp.]|jgi:signal peptidase I|nr:signal peptidase I [Treponema sp.]